MVPGSTFIARIRGNSKDGNYTYYFNKSGTQFLMTSDEPDSKISTHSMTHAGQAESPYLSRKNKFMKLYVFKQEKNKHFKILIILKYLLL